MVFLSVQKLCDKRTSTTSIKTRATVVGRFIIITQDNPDPHRRRGTILLNDLTTLDSIYCRVDQFHHELVNIPVSITRWNFIKPDNNSNIIWLEVYLEDIYPLGNPSISLIQQLIKAEQIANDLFVSIRDVSMLYIQDLLTLTKRNVTITDSSLQLQPQQQPLHVIGCISARLIRNLQPGEEAEFYIELTGLGGNTTATMVFEGDDLLIWYHTFKTNEWYVFTYLETAAIVIEGIPARGVLRFVPGQSRCYRMDKDQLKQFKTGSFVDYNMEEIEEKEKDGEPQIVLPPPGILKSAESTSMTSYEGTITRVIDRAFGIYELNHQLITCLFHYIDYALIYPYRPGTRIRISCAHMLAVDSGSSIMQIWAAPTTEHGDYKAHVVLVGCLKTHVEIVEFPKHTQCPSFKSTPKTIALLSLHGPIYKDCIRTKADFDTLIQKLEFQASLIHKFKKSIVPATRLHLFCNQYTGKIKSRLPLFGDDIFQDIFQHENACTAVKTRKSTVTLVKMPAVCDIAKMLFDDEERRVQISRHAGERGSSRDDLRVNLKMATYDQMEINIMIMGIVGAMPDGRLYLMDDTGKLPLVVLPEENRPDHPIHMGDLYTIRRFLLIREDLGYQEEKGSRVLLDCSYIVCSIHDLKRVASIGSGNQKSIAIKKAVDTKTVTGFKRKREEQQIEENEEDDCEISKNNKVTPRYILCILDIQPPILTHREENTFELTSHVRAIRYPVIANNNSSTKKKNENNKDERPEEIEIIFSSRTKSLQFLPQLYPGCWMGLATEDEDEFKVVETAKYLPKNMNLPIIPPKLILDPKRHHLFTTLPQQHMLDFIPITIAGVSLAPSIKQIFATTTLKGKQKIFQVKDIIQIMASSTTTLLVNNKNGNNDDDRPSMIEIGNRFFQDTVSVQGVIVGKGFREQQTRAKATIDSHARQIFEEFGVGTGQPGRNQLFFRVRQTNGLDTVDIYMDVWNRTYPLGLVPGALVTFHRLVRKKSDFGSVTCQMLPCSWAEVSELRNPQAEEILTEQIPCKNLVDIGIPIRKLGKQGHNNSDPTVFKIQCAVKSIIQVSLGWKCGTCGTNVKNNKCYRLCKQANRVFMANALAVVNDGTSQARAHFDGDQLVFKLLNVQENLMDGIKTAVLEHGRVTYQSYDDQNMMEVEEMMEEEGDTGDTLQDQELTKSGVTLPKLCRRVLTTGKVYTMFARERAEKLKKDATIMQQLKIQTISTEGGQPVAVVEQPHIVVVDLDLVDPAERAWDLAMRLDKLCTNEPKE
ncbi:CST, telomere maintenance, complex subunit CTC1-domain-containing protein [Phascolomyces articulosus]|uniref:CST complex subunit CTC1 n=1 Tax=Phascolomyces articulosus TaxID=60185 RepID=A0AAD5KJ03_9FUNG|nr:CST, telomere maintenance, complex subunit CTC1-domain-containing protein [Phascolomyces articulosus]